MRFAEVSKLVAAGQRVRRREWPPWLSLAVVSSGGAARSELRLLASEDVIGRRADVLHVFLTGDDVLAEDWEGIEYDE